jgi:hypothetical protein
MDVLAQVVVWLNAVANAFGGVVLAPIAILPEWLSATLIAGVTGLLLLLVFKYTSNQRAIKAVRNDIKAHLLALKLFKDSTSVVLRAQGRVFLGAFRLLMLAVVPLLVMLVPVFLLLGQLALWYQHRPLRIGEDAVITVKLNGNAESSFPDVRLQPTNALEVREPGRVRVFSKREICWNITARERGYHRLVFHVDGQARKGDESSSKGSAPFVADKELAIGDGFMQVSVQRPGWDWWEALLNPLEPPFRPDSPIRSIEIKYPGHSTWTIWGLEPWILYWFVVAMIAALAFRRWLNVNI